EVGEVRVHRRRRREPDGLADLADRRRIAVTVDVLDEEPPDLLLPCREHLASRESVSNVCSLPRVEILSDGVKSPVTSDGRGKQCQTSPTSHSRGNDVGFPRDRCAGEDLNLHDLAVTRPSTLRVY